MTCSEGGLSIPITPKFSMFSVSSMTATGTFSPSLCGSLRSQIEFRSLQLALTKAEYPLLELAQATSLKDLNFVSDYLASYCSGRLPESSAFLESAELASLISNLDIKIILRNDTSPLDSEIKSQEQIRKDQMIDRIRFAQSWVFYVDALFRKDLLAMRKFASSFDLLREAPHHDIPFSQAVSWGYDGLRTIVFNIFTGFQRLFDQLISLESNSTDQVGDVSFSLQKFMDELVGIRFYFTERSNFWNPHLLTKLSPVYFQSLSSFLRLLKRWVPLLLEFLTAFLGSSKHKEFPSYVQLERDTGEFLIGWNNFLGN